MSNQLNNNIFVAAPKHIDARYGVWEAGEWRPFNGIAEALTIVEEGLRFDNMTLTVLIGEEHVDYWFLGGVTDLHFVRKDYDKIRSELTVVGISVGEATDGKVYSAGTTQEEIIRDMLQKTVNPTFTAPSFQLSRDVAYLQRIGASVTILLSGTFSRGNIFQPWNNQSQGFRSGAPIEYIFAGNGLNQTGLFSTATHTWVIALGLQSFYGTVNYDAGPQPLNNRGQNFSTPLAPGALNSMVSVEGVHPIYATIANITAQTEMALISMLTGNNVEITLAAETGPDKQTFWLPKAWTDARPLVKIEYFNTVSNQFDTTNQAGQFTTSVVQIGGVNYLRYVYNGSSRGQIKIRLIF